MLEAYEHISSGGKDSIVLRAYDGWEALRNWQARCQFRWNKEPGEMSVKQILEFILARVGLRLEAKSSSPAMTNFYPDFTVYPGDSGEGIIKHLLTFVPDIIFIEGTFIFLNLTELNPADKTCPLISEKV